MTHLIIRKVAVLGAGVMGTQIAAHLMNARVPVILFDLPAQEGPKNAIAQQAIAHLRKLKPAPLGLAADAQFIECANYEDHLEKLKECDLVIEVIAERIDYKHDLYQKIAPALSNNTILVSNTSGLSIAELGKVLPAELKARFCGVHFFNPPRHMQLVELIATPDTSADLLNGLEAFLTNTLGKGVVRTKDTPTFIANRVGTFAMLAVMAETEKFGLSIDLVDDLTGKRLGHPKSATYRTVDIVGLDTWSYVIKTMRDNLADDPFSSLYQTPALLTKLLNEGALGQKNGVGFYKKVGKTVTVIDAKLNEYVASGTKADPLIERILARSSNERLKLLRESAHPQAQFLWSIFRDIFHYAAVHLETIANNARDVDLAIRWGFGWSEGPFETWQASGWQQVAQWIKDDIEAGKALSNAPLPAWVFNGPVADQGGVHTPTGSWSPMAGAFVAHNKTGDQDKPLFRTSLFGEQQTHPSEYGKTLLETNAVRIWVDPSRAEDDLVIISFKTKLNTISPDVLEGLTQAIEIAEKDYKGLIIWQPSSLQADGAFCAGADLKSLLPKFMAGGASHVEPVLVQFQRTMQRLKYAQVPVVSAIAGLALGGGCELALHSAKRVAHFESYIGLVEVGVGILPAAGGLKEIALRAAQMAQCTSRKRGDLIEFLQGSFQNVALAKVSGSALEARSMNYLKETDPIIFNRYELLETAKREARAMAAAGWRPPLRPTGIPVAGKAGIAAFKSYLVNLCEGGFISDHDLLISSAIAEVICGGTVEAGSLVDEEWLLKLERKACVALTGNKKSQERLMGMLQTGKPVRN